MKLLFSMLFAAVMAFSLQAVTVAWNLENSNWGAGSDWTGQTPTTGATLQVLVFFSEENYDAAGAADHVKKNGATTANYETDTYGGYNTTNGAKAQVFATGLNSKTQSGSYNSGYYYMVVFEGNNTTNGNYAVAKTSYIANGVDTKQGVYDIDITAGQEPGDLSDMTYVDLNWIGGTWKAPQTAPEPTVMALLALGVAGLALRRKNA